MKKLTVIKIGGNIVDKPDALQNFLNNFHKLEGPKVLIHGGGVLATELSAKLGIEVKMHNGRRITDDQTLKLVTMVYAGLINKQITASLQKIGCNAIGLSGADGNSVPAVKRPADPIDWGYVGDVDPARINTSLLAFLLDKGLCPVFCAITHDSNGSLLNTNADTMASNLAIALSKDFTTRLVYCFEKDGVLSDPDNNESVIPLITKSSYRQLLEEKKVIGGMIPKLDNAFSALENGVSEVVIKHADNLLNSKETLLKLR